MHFISLIYLFFGIFYSFDLVAHTMLAIWYVPCYWSTLPACSFSLGTRLPNRKRKGKLFYRFCHKAMPKSLYILI